MKKFEANIETLKEILESIHNSEKLDSHPWTKTAFVQEIVTSHPNLADRNPGEQLLTAIAELFREMAPASAPKHGIRIDARWSQFGFLAAKYFSPVLFGNPVPTCFQDAWEKMDESILLFVYGKPKTDLSSEEITPYVLVGSEPEVTPLSTLSDWHRKGLQRLAELIQARENYLAKSISEAGISSAPADLKEPVPGRASTVKARRFVILFLAMLLAGLIVAGGLKARYVYGLALIVRQDAQDLQSLLGQDTSRLERVREAGPALSTLRQDFNALKAEAEPYLWMGPWLEWAPTYGGDLAAVDDLVTLADSLLATADASYRAILPLVEENDRAGLDLPRLTEELLRSEPQLLEARQTLEVALAARSRLKPDALSPEVRDLILNDVDRLLPLLEDGLAVGLEFPRLLGATDEGPKTYLLLVQNEDELRPTGGFITAAGTLLLHDGKISNLDFSNSSNADDWTKPYPTAPWQLQEYMNSPVLIFRDVNWFTHYPTAASYAENLYSYSNNHSVDGVIAFDQHLLVELLGVTGPIRVEGVDYPIEAGNVIAYMRAAKTPTPEEAASLEWNNKAFINKLTRALMDKIFSGEVELEPLATLFLKVANEHHILVQLDNPVVTSVLEQYHWDGAVRPARGDFLMVVDTNVGFNKTNAVVESSQLYEVDLTKTLSPRATLTVVHHNKATGVDACDHWEKLRVDGEKDYPIQDCYWNYLRVFTPRGTFLLDATPQSIPADWMILKHSPVTQVDMLDEEIDGVQGFGTIQVVPASDSLTTRFQFLLPTDVIQPGPESGQWLYRLTVQKQPGTLAVPITIRIQLPANASVIQAPAAAVVEGSSVLLETDLQVDLQIELFYQIP